MSEGNELIKNVDQMMGIIEHDFNGAGHIPLVSCFSGALRTTIGKVEIMASLFLGLYVWIATRDFKLGFETLFKYSVHGVANICRGMIEFIPFVGNYICKIHDDNEEKNRWKYTYEKEPLSTILV